MNKFKIKSKFKPTGDQPKAIKQLVTGLENKEKDQVLLGVTGSGKTFTMANVIEKVQRPTLVISHNKTLAAQLAGEFQDFFPKNAIHYFVSYYDYYMPESYIPQSDTYIEKETSINEEIDRLRHAATQALLTRKDVIIVASVSCIFGLGSPTKYEGVAIKLKVNDKKIGRQETLKKLIEIRFERNDIDFHRGTFRVNGPTVDIFPSFATDVIYRLTFKGDILSEIETLNPLTMKTESTKKLSEIQIFPATHYVSDFKNLDQILARISKDKEKEVKRFVDGNKLIEAQRLQQRVSHDIEMIKQTGYCNGIENYSRYFDGRKIGEPPYTLLDYYPKDWLMMIDESHMSIPQIRGMYAGDKARKENLIGYGFRLKGALDNRPLNFDEFRERMPQTIYVSATPGPYELERAKNSITEQLIRPTGLLDPKMSIRPIKHQIDDLMSEIEVTVKKNQRILITTMTKRMAEDLADYLQEANMKACYLHSEVNTLDRLEILKDLREGKYDILVGINLLREGLDLPEVSLVVILDADKEGFLRSDTALIQTMGRAARHIDGRTIMYADKITGSMQRAIDEIQRRREYQKQHNKKHNIKPKGIKKEIKSGILGKVNKHKETIEDARVARAKSLPEHELAHLIKDLENQMEISAQNLQFEQATVLRDQLKELNILQEKTNDKKAKKKGNRFATLKELK